MTRLRHIRATTPAGPPADEPTAPAGPPAMQPQQVAVEVIVPFVAEEPVVAPAPVASA